jgi:hypothetical protein
LKHQAARPEFNGVAGSQAGRTILSERKQQGLVKAIAVV